MHNHFPRAPSSLPQSQTTHADSPFSKEYENSELLPVGQFESLEKPVTGSTKYQFASPRQSSKKVENENSISSESMLPKEGENNLEQGSSRKGKFSKFRENNKLHSVRPVDSKKESHASWLDSKLAQLGQLGVKQLDRKGWSDAGVQEFILGQGPQDYKIHTSNRLDCVDKDLEAILPGLHFDSQGRPLLYRAQSLEATLACMKSSIDEIKDNLPHASGSTEFSTTASLTYASEYVPVGGVVTVFHFNIDKFKALFSAAYRSNELSKNKKMDNGAEFKSGDFPEKYAKIKREVNRGAPRLKAEGERKESVEKTASYHQITAQFPTKGDRLALIRLMDALEEVGFVHRNGGVEAKADKRMERIRNNEQKKFEKKNGGKSELEEKPDKSISKIEPKMEVDPQMEKEFFEELSSDPKLFGNR